MQVGRRRGPWPSSTLLEPYARERGTDDGAEEAGATTTRLLEHYRSLASDGDPDWLGEERANVVAACLQAAEQVWARQVVDLADVLWRCSWANGAHYLARS